MSETKHKVKNALIHNLVRTLGPASGQIFPQQSWLFNGKFTTSEG